MVARFGMGGQLGPVTYETDQGGYLGQVVGPQRRYAEETAREIDMAVRDLVDGAFQRARLLLVQNRDLLVEGARRLLEKETLSDAELAEVLGRVRSEVPQAG
jgi:cell division protease FtsH